MHKNIVPCKLHKAKYTNQMAQSKLHKYEGHLLKWRKNPAEIDWYHSICEHRLAQRKIIEVKLKHPIAHITHTFGEGYFEV